MLAIRNQVLNADGLLVVETIDGEVFIKAISAESSPVDIYGHLLELEDLLILGALDD